VRSLGVPLRKHYWFLCDMLKASSASPVATASSLSSLFSAQYAETVRWLDFSKPAGTVPPISWAEVAFREFQEFREALTGTLNKYALFFEPDLATAIERLVTSELVGFAGRFRTLVLHHVHPGYFADPAVSQTVFKYT
jgi:hypothetical protein